MARILRTAMTQTRNAFEDMPDEVAGLQRLAGRLDEVRAANVEHHLGLLAEAASAGARIVGLGELFPAPYFALHRDEMWLELAEDALTGPTVRAMCGAAREHGLILVAPLYELDPSSGRRFNTAVVIDAGGNVLGRYRKTHIPGGANERAAFDEAFYYAASDGRMENGPADVSQNPFFPVFQTEVGRIAVATCYDRHFPGVLHTLARNGAELVFSPAVTFGEKSRRMWELEFPVDAARHGVFIGGSNRLGSERPWDVEYFGSSYFCGPNGRVEPRESHPELVLADLDLGALERPDPAGWDLVRDARPDIYGS